MKTISQITKKIEALKRALIRKAEKKGLYECFGLKEQDALCSYIGDIWNYSGDERSKILKLENGFCAWCFDYT